MEVPFKAICINVPSEWREAKRLYNIDHPEVLDDVVVTEAVPHSECDALMYGLDGYKVEDGYIRFNSKNFATLPEQSADEIEGQEKEAIIYAR